MTHQRSPMSITELVNSTDESDIVTTTKSNIDIEDPDVKIAAQVLGDMARISSQQQLQQQQQQQQEKIKITLPPLSAPSTTPSSPLPTPTCTDQRLSFSSESTVMDEDQSAKQSHFIHRVSNIPLVNSALRAYESSKNSSSVVKYGAEMVESFAAPIYDKFGKHASMMVDEWGCKQLDKLESRYPAYVKKDATTADSRYECDEGFVDDDNCSATSATFALSCASLDEHGGDSSSLRKRRDSRDEYSSVALKNRKSSNSSRSTSPHRPYSISKPVPNNRHRQQPLVRSKWHQIVMHASSAAGTTAAVISEESMKCLRYCLSWLQYASQHIDQQMDLLKKFLVSLSSNNNNNNKTMSTTHEDFSDAATVLANIKKEIVDTLRKVVDVISKYAGSGLPEQAKAAVRGFILALPSRWAVLNSPTTASSHSSPRIGPTDETHETSIKLLNFGAESVDMIKSVSNVFADTIDRAELWLNRLRVVGVAGNRTVTSNNKKKEDIATSNNGLQQMDLS